MAIQFRNETLGNSVKTLLPVQPSRVPQPTCSWTSQYIIHVSWGTVLVQPHTPNENYFVLLKVTQT